MVEWVFFLAWEEDLGMQMLNGASVGIQGGGG